jgi:hypothetical protein
MPRNFEKNPRIVKLMVSVYVYEDVNMKDAQAKLNEFFGKDERVHETLLNMFGEGGADVSSDLGLNEVEATIE